MSDEQGAEKTRRFSSQKTSDDVQTMKELYKDLINMVDDIFSFYKIITLGKRVEKTFPIYLSRCLVWTLLLSWLAPYKITQWTKLVIQC